MNRKPRGDAKLKTLTEARQGAIAEYAAAHTLAETLSWLKQDGLKTSSAALSEFLSWYGLRGQLQRNRSTVEELMQQLRKTNPTLLEEELFAAGQAFFTALAIEQQDSLSWKRAQDARVKKDAIKLLERRVKLLEEREAETKRKLAAVLTGPAKGGLSAETLRAIEEAAGLL